MINKRLGSYLVSLVALLVLLAGIAQLGAGVWRVGVTLDEPTHVSRTQSWLTHGWYVPERLMNDGRPIENEQRASPFIYGPGFSSLAHAANVAVGNESIGELSNSKGSHGTRHFVVAVLGLLAAGAVGLCIWALTNSRRFALWGAAGLLSIPVWMGHSFFNIKDIPAAVGYTLVSTALVLALVPKSDVEFRWFKRLAVGAMLTIGVYIGVGTRFAFWAAVAVSVALFFLLDLGQRKLGHVPRPRGVRTLVLFGFGLGIASVALVYPNNAAEPAAWLSRSVVDSAGYLGGPVLTAGMRVVHPWWYLPAWVMASLPLFLGALAVFGVMATAKSLVRRSTPHRTSMMRIWHRPAIGAIIILFQALLLPVGTTLIGATMYDGLRQHLYVVPPIAVFAGVGAHTLWSRFVKPRRATARASTIAVLVLTLALLIPTAEQLLLFPYNYTYVNAIAGIGGVNDRWETDYWFASAPEALTHVPMGVELVCTDDILRHGQLDNELSVHPCPSSRFSPFASMRGDAMLESETGSFDDAWVISWKRGGNQAPSYCRIAHEVTRWLRGEQVVMSFVLNCDRERLH